MTKSVKERMNKIISAMLVVVLLVSQFSIFGDIEQEKLLVVGQTHRWYNDASLNGASTGFTEFEINGRTAYCVDYRFYYPQTKVPVFEKRLGAEATAVLVNGYPNVTPAQLGVSTELEAMLATQLAFWNVLGVTKECDSYVQLKFSNLSALAGKEAAFSRALNAAKKIAANAFSNPYKFNASIRVNSSSADLKISGSEYVAGPYTLDVKGTKIANYKVNLNSAPRTAYVTNGKGSKTTQIGSNDKFYIRWKASEEGQTIKYDISTTGNKSVVNMYRTGKYGIQNIGFEEFLPETLRTSNEISFNTAKGNIQVLKVDENGSKLQNATFILKDAAGNKVAEGTSNKDGIVSFSDLKVGDYTLVETYAPNGYVLNTTPVKVTVKSRETVKVTVKNNKISGSLKIVKTDDVEGKPLAGVTFQILNSNKAVVDTITTDANGIAVSKKLPYGKYTYKEIKVPSNILLDKNEYPFSITRKDSLIVKNVVNTVIKGGLKIVKVNDQNEPISGVKFDIKTSAGKLVETIVTDENGVANTKALVNGAYTYTEVSAPTGVIVDSKTYSFNLTGNNIIEKKIVNQRIKGNIKIVKVDDQNKAIAGVTFEILDQNKTVVDTIVTNAKGIATSKYLPMGTYIYKEVSAPAGYVVNKTEYTFEIKTAYQTISKTVVNKRATGSLKIVKTDDKFTPIAGVKFEIKNAAGTIVDTITTNAQGVAVSKRLPIGTYNYKEIYVPSKYILDSTVKSFKITTDSEVITKTVINQRAKGTLKIVKVNDKNQKISGVEFTIYNSSNVEVDKITTNDEGMATSKYLPLGKYTYKETKAPAGYVIDTTAKAFELTANAQVKTFTVVNQRQKGQIKVVKTTEDSKPLAGVTFNVLDYKDNVVATIVTNNSGIATTGMLPIGIYNLKETKVPAGIILDPTEHEITLSQNKVVVTKNIINKFQKGSLKIIKTDDTKKPLAGVTFEILDSNKKVVDTITTNAQGIAISKQIKLGTYTYKETKVPAGIVLDSSEYVFTLNQNNQVITKEIVNVKMRGGLKIVKVDENNLPIAGVKFQIINKDGKVVETLTTNEAGIAVSSKLDLGAYTYKEISAPNGVIVDSTAKPFEVKTQTLVEVKVINKIAKGTLKILKVDDSTNPVAGAKFEIKNEAGIVVDTITTNAQGVAVSKALRLGKYTYREIYAPNGYVLNTQEYSFELTTDNQVVIKNMINVRSKGKLEIIKVDQDNERIGGVTFEIKNEAGEIVDTIVTSTNGVALTKALPLGKYTYRETKVPAGYIMDSKSYNFTLTENNKTITKTVVNEQIKGKLRIIKVDDSGNALAGVKFEILNEKKQVIATLVTGNDGITNSEELELGTYFYREVEAPEGIIMDTKEYMFKVEKDGQVVIKNIVNVREKPVVPEKETGNLLILKVDKQTKEPIAGVTFQILDSNKNVIETLVTDKDGRLKSSKLELGTYFYKEIKAPEKYIVDDKEYKFEIKNNGDQIYKTVTNQAKKLPQTGGLGTNNMIILMVSLLSVIGFIVFRKKEENC